MWSGCCVIPSITKRESWEHTHTHMFLRVPRKPPCSSSDSPPWEWLHSNVVLSFHYYGPTPVSCPLRSSKSSAVVNDGCFSFFRSGNSNYTKHDVFSYPQTRSLSFLCSGQFLYVHYQPHRGSSRTQFWEIWKFTLSLIFFVWVADFTIMTLQDA